MIRTSYRGKLLIALDRNSARHNWRLIVSSDNIEHVKLVAEKWAGNAKISAFGHGPYPEYQQAIVLVDIKEDGTIPDNLPRNTRFGPMVDGVYQGIRGA